MTHVLPDVLSAGLDVVFVGSAASDVAARLQAYYAGPGNRFWPTLHVIGLTPVQLQPSEFRRVLEFGIGLTDLNKSEHGGDATLSRKHDDAPALVAKLTAARPRAIAFNGLRAARGFLGRRDLLYGRQPADWEGIAVFVLPSTSGAARGPWKLHAGRWPELGASVRAMRADRT